MFAIVICLVLLMCILTIGSSGLCVLMVDGMSVVVNVMLSMSVMSPPPALCSLSVRTVMYFGCFGDEFGLLNCDYICMCVVNSLSSSNLFLNPFMMLVWGPGELCVRIWVIHVVKVFCLVHVTCLR